MHRTCYPLLIASFLAVVPAFCQSTFTYQGRLTQNGAIIQGPTTQMLTFQLCDGAVGGNVLSSNTMNVTVLDSLFSAELAFPTAHFDGSPRWLQIRIGDASGPALLPRQSITGVPYAIYALKAAAGNSLSAADGDPAAAVYVNNDGWVGIGTTSPAADLHVRAPSGDALAEFRIGPGVSESSSQLYLSENVTGSYASIIRHNGADNRLDFLGVNGGAEVGPNMMVRRDSGFVGLGTADNPAARLHVNGDSIWLSGTDSGSLGSTAGAGLRLHNTATESHIYGYDYATGAARNLVLESPGGNVGIGVASPLQRLSVAGTVQSTTGGFMFPDGTLQTTAATGGGGYWNSSGTNISNNNSGNVGIGTVAPASKLHIEGVGRIDGNVEVRDAANALRLVVDPDSSSGQMRVDLMDTDGTTPHVSLTAGGSNPFGQFGGTLRLYDHTGDERATLSGGSGVLLDVPELTLKNADGENVVLLDTLGRFSLTDPGGTNSFEVYTNDPDYGTSLTLYDRNGSGISVVIDASEADGNGQIEMFSSGGKTIQIDGDVGSTHEGYIAVTDPSDTRRAIILDSNDGGSARVTTQVLEITGGSDLSEQFEVTGPAGTSPQPGMVVVIDELAPGGLRVASEPYDPKVAGVVSGAGGLQPGLLMGQRGTAADGRFPVALTGRVYVWVDADIAPIKPGDLLTTSPTLGHAMRVGDRTAADGAILGKAMTRLDSGRGLVLMLVNLK